METGGDDNLFCEIAIDLGFFDKIDATKALESQRVDEAIGESKPIGAYLFEMGLITKEQIGTILKMRDRMTSSQASTSPPQTAPIELSQTPPSPLPSVAPSARPSPPSAVSSGTSESSLSGVNSVNPGTVIGLSIVTLGIYGMYFFYTCALSYKRALPNRSSYFVPVFWVYVVTSIIGIAIAIAQSAIGALDGAQWTITGVATVLGIVLLMEVMRMRQEMLQKYNIASEVHSNATHLSLYIVGSLLAVVFVGIIFLIIQAVLFIGDHNRIADSAATAKAN